MLNVTCNITNLYKFEAVKKRIEKTQRNLKLKIHLL